jgi:acetylornithine deacetylase/succinyl-diaminopimelate desuccinylase family protein
MPELISPVIRTLADLVRINSVNPAYDGGVSEAEVVRYVEDFFHPLGLEMWQQEVFPGRPNLIVKLPGKNPARRIVLEAHTDTVSVAGMTIDPLEPTIANGCLYGRGSCDTKAGLAGMMHAVASLRQQSIMPACEVWLVAAADEEFSYRGVVKLCEGLTGNAAIIAEPTELRMVVASKGVVRWRIRVQGRAAHSSKPHLGINAINHMARLVLAIDEHHKRLDSHSHPLLGCATGNVGVIHGGVQVNFVPDQCLIEIDRRLLPGEQVSVVLQGYQAVIDRLGEQIGDFVAIMESPMLTDEALDTPLDSPVAMVASDILRSMGLCGDPCGVPFGSDASKLSRQGLPSLVFGPGSIDCAHAAVEYVEIDQVDKAFEFYRQFISKFE